MLTQASLEQKQNLVSFHLARSVGEKLIMYANSDGLNAHAWCTKQWN